MAVQSWYRSIKRSNIPPDHMNSQTLEYLSQIALFARLTDEDRNKVANRARIRKYEENQDIVFEGDDLQPVYFVVEGKVQIYRTNPEGRQQTIIELGPGRAFNETPPFSDIHTCPASARALLKSTLLAIEQSDFSELVIYTPKLAQTMLKELSNKLRHFVRLTHDLSLRTVRGRLAQFLVQHTSDETNNKVTRLTREQIAEHIGTVREVVSRTLRSFVRDGLIDIKRQQIIVLDRKALEEEIDL